MPAKINSRHTMEDRGHDLYETPACAVEALLKVETLPEIVWEPACGPGAIVRVLQAGGHQVVATDLVDYGLQGARSGIDFLNYPFPKTMPKAIVTNPPFSIATEFATRAVALAPKVCLLLRINFLASTKRTALLERSHLARVHIFRNRLPMMHRDGWKGAKTGSNVDHAWFVFDRSHIGPAQLNRISWEPSK
jgi:hypothetical protein